MLKRNPRRPRVQGIIEIKNENIGRMRANIESWLMVDEREGVKGTERAMEREI